jgi:hypothetical protein
MKNIVIAFLVFFTLQVLAQKPSELRRERVARKQQIKDSVDLIDNNNKYFGPEKDRYKNVSIPDSWKKKSSVVLLLSKKIEVKTTVSSTYDFFNVTKTSRITVKLNDKKAVSEFTEFYFEEAGSQRGVRIYKPNNTFVDVPLFKAVTVSSSVSIPSVFQGFSTSNSHKKIAIPNLEVGDIIDFYSSGTYTDNRYLYFAEKQSFTVPVLEYSLQYNISPGQNIASQTYNQSNKFQVSDSTTSGGSSSKKLSLNISKINPTDYKRWEYFNLSHPYSVLTFKMVKEEEAYSALKPEVMATEINKTIMNQYVNIVPFIDYSKKKIDKKTPKNEIVEMAYYFIRANDELNAYNFVKYMWNIGEKYDIPCKLVLSMPRHYGIIDNTIGLSDIHPMIKMGDMIISVPDKFDCMEEMPNLLKGTKAYVCNFNSSSSKITEVESIQIPDGISKENYSFEESTISFLLDSGLVEVDQLRKVRGFFRQNWSKEIIWAYDFKDESEKYKSAYYTYSSYPTNPKDLEDYKKSIEEKRKVQFEEELEEEFYLKELKSYQIVSLGRVKDSTDLIFKQRYTIENVINQNKKFTLIDIGELIGSQMDLTEDEWERSTQVNIDCPRLIEYKFKINIPAGKKIKGIENLTTTVDNAFGRFATKATLENNVLTLTAVKEYKKQQIDAKNWDQMKAFLVEAKDFTKKKIILE